MTTKVHHIPVYHVSLRSAKHPPSDPSPPIRYTRPFITEKIILRFLKIVQSQPKLRAKQKLVQIGTWRTSLTELL
jgi:hypothetical protein